MPCQPTNFAPQASDRAANRPKLRPFAYTHAEQEI